ncbi:MAG: efflux RND transporter permease subunit [Betaproteobacteria bacterium]|jgi:cobalt-zinc-cadmium resistance protein CzcA|nr:efflux RND transporter permease subunit [Rhodocyclaceae bacterium]MCA3133705.1 efflux RND transporter permease subunit [Rhodocyclaceae bacterium]MCA3143026.1 efflux RND transporter permease subunit [Rhodocyclaceae bacterium]MCA3144133.1 efflux RND transporter permease subunit [Rhodocyclaceae bacterium]MCE2898226.1 CusA/CzcA family heavy metal efflux RND transporter [Betaproteobacteria bacterium]
MLNRLVAFCLRQRLLVAALTLVMAALGVQALLELPIDAFPDVSSTQVKIILKAPGMTPEEVESRIVQPVELEMLGIPRQRLLRSVSKVAIADVTIDFQEGTDIYWARQQVNERLSNVLPDLPAGVSGGMAPITTPLGEMFMFTIEGGELSLAQRRTLLDWTIRPRLRTVPGVADVNPLGGHVRAFEVVPDSAALAARGITLSALEAALAANNRNDGAGRLKDGEEALLVRAEGSIRTLEDVRAIVVGERNAVPVRVAEVAEVRVGSLTRYGAVTRDGRGEAVQGLVLGLRGANARAVVEGVRGRLAEIAPLLPPGVHTEVFYDRGALVDRAVGTVSRALIEAIVLVVIMLLLMLGDLRAAVVVAATLPLAALATFFLMEHAGMSANLMSLGGLAIAIGMLVDASVVVVENVVSHLAHDAGRGPKLRVVYEAVREVAVPVASGIAIIVIVFLPLLTLEGLEGKLFKPVAWSIIFALSASLVLALTVIPVLASALVGAGAHREPWLVRKAQAAYAPLLESALGHPRLVAAVAAAMLAAATGAYLATGKTFMPVMDEGDIIMQLEKLPSISLDSSLDLDLRLQRAVLEKVPEVSGVVARTGADELGLDPMGLNQTDTFLVLKPREQWRSPDKQAIVESLRQVVAGFPGVNVTFTQPIEMRVAEMLTGVRGDLAVKIFGPDLPVLNRLSREIEAALKAVPGNRDVFTLTNEGMQYLRAEINRFATGHQKLTVDEIEADLRTQLEGRRVGTVIEAGRRTPLILRGRAELRESASLFQNQNVVMPDGKSVPLATVASLARVDGPVKVDRENALRYAVVQSSVLGRDLVGFVDDAKAAVAAKVKLPEGYSITWGGQFENQQRAAARLAVVIPIALALIFMLLFATFGSLRQALLVFANIPFAMVGGIVALWGSGEYLSVPASVGFIALLGIAVLNGVVLMSTFNQLRAAGMAVEQVVREGARRRLRPVLMTASIAALGLVPLLAATGPGSEIQRPLAIVVIGGLVTSTALTLLILPLLYQRFGDLPACGGDPLKGVAP